MLPLDKQPSMREQGQGAASLPSPHSPNTDMFDSSSPHHEIRRRMSTSAAQSVQMKVFRVCDCAGWRRWR